jgi:two-component system, chemotaxis family, sensor kinase CheA
MANLNQEDFLNELREDFKLEADEHLQQIVNGLLLLEKNEGDSQNTKLIETIFREIHSLKGAARAVNLLRIERLCMHVESVFHEIKKGNLPLRPEMFDVFHQAADNLKLMVVNVDGKSEDVSEKTLSKLIAVLDGVLRNQFPTPRAIFLTESPNKTEEVPEPSKKTTQSENGNSGPEKETVRVSTTKLYDLLRQAEEMIAIKVVLSYQVDSLLNIVSEFGDWRRKHEEVLSEMNTCSENDKEFLQFHEQQILRTRLVLEQINRSAGRAVDELVFDIKKTLRFPFSSILAIIPKIVRDLGKEYEKEIDLFVEGGEIEIDRRILEELKDPIIHLIRNCIDHGLENRTDRISAGKPIAGKLRVMVMQRPDHKVELVISDDGAGINRDKLIESAIQTGVLKPDGVDQMVDNEIDMLVFSSGVSTSSFITDISGRGLGMAIVLSNLNKIGGTIDIESAKGKGTSYKIVLPQSLASFRGVVVKVSEQLLVVPTNTIISAIRVGLSEIVSVESQKTIRFQSENIALLSLAQVLGLPRQRSDRARKDTFRVLIVAWAQRKIAFIVDEVLGEYEGVVKSLGLQLKHVINVAGTIILGDGKIAVVLQVPELLESATRGGIKDGSVTESVEFPTIEGASNKHLLIVEDSITVRNMLRNLTEAAGFTVKTAVDGFDAFNLLQKERFDLVVSDVEMPRLNGFELTAKIRQDKALSDMPIILVTALDSPDDRNRGMEAGANAYIVKGSFEKSNLIDTINRLI